MPTPAALLQAAFHDAIRAVCGVDADPMIGPAQNEKFGDYQANVAMSLAKQLAAAGQKTNPRQLGQAIRDAVAAKPPAVDGVPVIDKLEVAGPGFINIHLANAFIDHALRQARGNQRLAIDVTATPLKTVVDYSGPNVAKEMHVGHLRSTIIGDAVSRVLEFRGDPVIRQNHIGDWGTQFGMLIAYLAEGGSAAEESISDLETFYVAAKKRFDSDPAFAARARETVVRLQAGNPAERKLWQTIVEKSRLQFEAQYKRLNVKLTPNDERAESFYNPMLADVVEELLQKQVAKPSEGAVAVFVKGFENPLLIRKSDGGYLYATTDLAAIKYRVQNLGAHRIVYVHDSRQAQHFAQVFATATEAGWVKNVELKYVPFGTILGTDGKPLRTREGGTIKLRLLLDEALKRAAAVIEQKNPDLPSDRRADVARAVGIGAVKYFDLNKDRTSDYVFSWDHMLSLDGNSGPYLMYAYARVCGIFRKWGGDAPPPQTPISLNEPAESALAKHLLRLGDVIDAVATELRPHLLCTYLYEIATRFSVFFETCPVLKAEPAIRAGRLALCDLTARTLACGLDLLGIEHPQEI
jgi:arginyl-tRNA synthetase